MKKFSILFLLVFFMTACGSTSPAKQPAVKPEVQAAGPADTAVLPAVQPTEVQPGPAIDGATLLQDRCADCHSPDRVKDRPQTKDQWDRIVSNMIDRGAQLNDTEKQALVDYLAKTYGK